MRIYVASSWRNQYQPRVVDLLRSWGAEVYDFRNPEPGNNGFGWQQVGAPDYKHGDLMDPALFRAILRHPMAAKGYALDFGAMQWANTCVMVLPSGRSASYELGWMKGAGKRCIIYIPEPCEPELMYRDCEIVVSESELFLALSGPQQDRPKFNVGEMVRYGAGSSAVMRITSVIKSNRHWRYYGQNVVGASVGAYEADCRQPTPEDRQRWRLDSRLTAKSEGLTK